MRGANTAAAGTSCTAVARVEIATLERWCRDYSVSRDRELRARIVDHFDWLVRICVNQMTRRGESVDDLMQVGTIGLLNAIDRFDPAFGVQFRTFASATISGELRRHYRGAWRMKVARPLQERHLEVTGAIETLTGALRRSPTAKDIADHLKLDVDQVVEAYAVGSTFSPASLNTDVTEHHGARLHSTDRELQRAESRTDLRALLARLSERERKIVYLRFYREMTQSEIAAELGVSQVHVSRLLRSALETLRAPVRPGCSGRQTASVVSGGGGDGHQHDAA
jgi:RNA polymerase sigma-B factor